MTDTDRNILGLQETNYMKEFKNKFVPRESQIKKILEKDDEKIEDPAKMAPPKPREFWVGTSLVKVNVRNIPKFNEFQHEPKEIVRKPPIINFERTTTGTAAVMEWHKDIMRSRPKFPPAPCEPILDDVDEVEGREAFVKYTYELDHAPPQKVTNVEILGDEVIIPALKFSSEKFASVGRNYRQVKPNLKTRFRRHDAIQERNYDNFDKDFNLHHPKEFSFYEELWGKDIREVHEHDLTRIKYRNYTVGYTGHIPTSKLNLKSTRKWRVDPMIPTSVARDCCLDKNDCRIPEELPEKIKKIGTEEKRTEMGILHYPIQKYYRSDIANLPFTRCGDKKEI